MSMPFHHHQQQHQQPASSDPKFVVDFCSLHELIDFDTLGPEAFQDQWPAAASSPTSPATPQLDPALGVSDLGASSPGMMCLAPSPSSLFAYQSPLLCPGPSPPFFLDSPSLAAGPVPGDELHQQTEFALRAAPQPYSPPPHDITRASAQCKFAQGPIPPGALASRILQGDAKMGRHLNVTSAAMDPLGVNVGTQRLLPNVPSCGAQMQAHCYPSPVVTLSFNDRLSLALRHYLHLSKGDILVQVWIPQRNGKRVVLTTHGQPFVLQEHSDCLSYYRELSTNYTFCAEQGDTGIMPGLPGRVYLKKTPEWTPNVQFYKRTEYLRINDAHRCNVRGSLALPVLDRNSGVCAAVIELVMSHEKIEYHSETDSVCRALQEVNLCSSKRQSLFPLQIPTQPRQTVFDEISEVLKAVSETHKLPLAQTWVPCRLNGTNSSDLSNLVDPCRIGLCTGDGPYCLNDPEVAGFRQACSEQFLEKSQGLPGKAFTSSQPFFSQDIKDCSKAEYPLGHHARVFKLSAAVAIRLRSVHTSENDYVLEFFLPQACSEPVEQQFLLNALSITMQRVCRSLRTVSDQELEDERAACNDYCLRTGCSGLTQEIDASTSIRLQASEGM